tara:strand:- start:184 stop:351 length:168 start_codon:yes stop_codon:yes gene_type:complete
MIKEQVLGDSKDGYMMEIQKEAVKIQFLVYLHDKGDSCKLLKNTHATPNPFAAAE